MNSSDVNTSWTLKMVYDVIEEAPASGEANRCFEFLVVKNVTEEIIDTIAGYLGVNIRTYGNALCGSKPYIPICIRQLANTLWKSFESCFDDIWYLPTPLNVASCRKVYVAVYIWLGFMRLPKQSFKSLCSGEKMWEACVRDEKPNTEQ